MLADFKVSSKLALGYTVVIAVFLSLAVFQIYEVSHLGNIQDQGAKRSQDLQEIMDAALRAGNLYSIIADAQINRDLGQTRKDFAEAKAAAKKDMQLIEARMDTPEEKALAKEFAVSYNGFVEAFEVRMLPALDQLVKLPPESAEAEAASQKLRELDGQIDELRKTTLKHLGEITKSLAQENVKGDEEFDKTREMTVRMIIILSLLGSAAAAVLTFLTARAIVVPLRKGTAFAERLAVGDLEMVLDIKQKDEIGMLAEALRKVADAERGVADVAAHHRGAVAAHQGGRTLGHRLRKIAAHGHVGHQKRGVAEMVVGVPNRHLVADRRAHVENRLDFQAGRAERNHALAVVVDHRHHLGPRLVERAVDEAFEIGHAALRVDGRTVEGEFHDVGGLDALGRAGAG